MTVDLRNILGGIDRQAIPGLSLPARVKALVLAPHPDDFDAIGVTLRFLQDNGHSLRVGVCRTGSGVEDCYRPGLSPADRAVLREQEQRDSLRFFGLPADGLTFLNLENDADDQPVDSPANREILVGFMSAAAPDIVFLPHGNDTNSGHRAIYSLFRQVARDLPKLPVAFLNRDPKTIAMRIDVCMPFGPDPADWKARLLRFHDSQHQRNLRTRGHGFDERILEVNRQIAKELSIPEPFAEAFEIEVLGSYGVAAGSILLAWEDWKTGRLQTMETGI